MGPNRKVLLADLLRLREPRFAGSEIPGNILLAIGKDTGQTRCGVYGTPAPARYACAVCGESIELQPSAVLGCVTPGCPERLWEFVFCPACDGAQSDVTAVRPTPTAAAAPLDIDTALAGLAAAVAAGEAEFTQYWKDQQIDKRLDELDAHPTTQPGGESTRVALRKARRDLAEARAERQLEKREAATSAPVVTPFPTAALASAAVPRSWDGNQIGVTLLKELEFKVEEKSASPPLAPALATKPSAPTPATALRPATPPAPIKKPVKLNMPPPPKGDRFGSLSLDE